MFGFKWFWFGVTAYRVHFVLLFPSVTARSVTAGVVVGRHVQVEEVLQLPLQSLECGPLVCVLLPAVHHEVIHDFGAARRAWHPVALWKLLDHLVVCHGWKNHVRMTYITDQSHFDFSDFFCKSVILNDLWRGWWKAHSGKASVQTSWSHAAEFQRTKHQTWCWTCCRGWLRERSTSQGILFLLWPRTHYRFLSGSKNAAHSSDFKLSVDRHTKPDVKGDLVSWGSGKLFEGQGQIMKGDQLGVVVMHLFLSYQLCTRAELFYYDCIITVLHLCHKIHGLTI